MPYTPQALLELEKVQQNQPSPYWLSRQENPLLLQSWAELALASTAWSWLDVEPPRPSSPIWKQVWDQALTWPINDELSYVEQSIVSWSDYPVWNSVRSMKLIQMMEQAQPRDWSTLMFQELQPQRFAYHLLHAVCLHPDKFQEVRLAPIWKLVVESPSLRADLKEVLLVTLLGSTDSAWSRIAEGLDPEHQKGSLSTAWLGKLKAVIPHRAQWLTDFEQMQANLGVTTIERRVLSGQWNILLNKSLWDKQVKAYGSFDFADALPGMF